MTVSSAQRDVILFLSDDCALPTGVCIGMSCGVTLARMAEEILNDSLSPSLELTLEHLEAICKSPFFVSSKRCQEFLRYIVIETTQGRGDQIKERNIAHEVFGKGGSFEPGENSLVRVKAGEVRKRLSDYYRATPGSVLRIELPLGGYVPSIHYSQEPPIESPLTDGAAKNSAKPLSRRKFAMVAGGSLAALGAASFVPLVARHPTALDLFWRPVFATNAPLLIFIPILTDKDGTMTEWVGLGPAAALGRAAEFLTQHHRQYRLRFGSDLTFTELREQPSLLLGGFDSEWILRMTRDLRFYPVESDHFTGRAFVDRQSNRVWKPVKQEPNPYVEVDYGILCRLFDSVTGQIVLIAVGTQTFGTEGAASAFFDPDLFAGLVKQAPTNWETKNIQAVIRVSMIGTTTSPPQLIATHFW